MKWISLLRLRNKIIYKCGVHFPYLQVRVWSLRALGWEVGTNVYFPEDIIITQNFVYNRGDFVIGNNVSIGPRCTLVLVSHPNYSTIRSCMPIKSLKIIIGDNAWLGAGVIVLPGITVGKNAVIGAGAVVTHDVPDYAIMAGVPAKKIGEVDKEN